MVGGFAFMDRGLNFKKGILADKKTRLILCALILLWVAVLTQVLMQHFMKQNVQIAEAFMDTEVVTSKSSIEIAGEYITKSLTDKQKESTAYHEAGHAIVARKCKHCDPVQEVSIIPRGNAARLYAVFRLYLPRNDRVSGDDRF